MGRSAVREGAVRLRRCAFFQSRVRRLILKYALPPAAGFGDARQPVTMAREKGTFVS